MRNLAPIAVVILGAMASSAMADTPAKTDKMMMAATKPAKPIKPTEMTCEEFLSYDEVTRPQIVYLSEGLNRKGKPEDAVIDVERINTLVPMLVEECKKEPHASYWQKMKEKFRIL